MLSVAETYLYEDFTYPLRVTRRTGLGTPDMGRQVNYLDGFGATVQARIEETPGTFLVTDQATDARGAKLWSGRPQREIGSDYVAHGAPGVDGYQFESDYVRSSIERTFAPRDPGDPRPPASDSTIHHGPYVESIDALGRRTRSVLDGFGSVVERIAYGAALGDAHTHLQYDGNGYLVGMVDPNGNTTTWARNPQGLVTSVIAPDLGAHHYWYDGRGAITEELDPRGVTVVYHYDPVGRLTQVSSSVPPNVRPVDETITYHTAATSSAELNWIATRAGDGVTQRFHYDAGGRVRELVTESTPYSVTVLFDHTVDGRLREITYGDGWTIRYNHFRDGAPRSVVDASTGAVIADSSRDANGRRDAVWSPLGFQNTYQYDARDRITRITSANTIASSAPLVDDQLHWSDGARLEALTRRGPAPGMQPRISPEVFAFGHDQLGRLRSVDRDGAPFARYDYDLGHRLISLQEGPAGPAFTYTYQVDRLTQRSVPNGPQQVYAHDAAGNVVGDLLIDGTLSSRGFRWDALGRIATTTTSSQPNTSRYVYLGGELVRVDGGGPSGTDHPMLLTGNLARYDLQDLVHADRVWLGSTLVGERRNGVFEWTHQTVGGTVAAVSNSNGAVLRQDEHFPYGTVESSSGSAAHDAGFHGLRRDSVLAAGPRAYDATAGRWLARDPLMRADPDAFAAMPSVDAYGYAHADPLSYRDRPVCSPCTSMKTAAASNRCRTATSSARTGDSTRRIRTSLSTSRCNRTHSTTRRRSKPPWRSAMRPTRCSTAASGCLASASTSC